MLLSVDQIFSKYPELASDAEAAVELIFTEYLARESLGQSNDSDEYVTASRNGGIGSKGSFRLTNCSRTIRRRS